MSLTAVLGQTVSMAFVPSGFTTGNYVILDGAIETTSLVVEEIGNTGVHNATFTPTQTGTYTVIAMGAVAGVVRVVEQDLYSILQDLKDSAMGSWEWNKVTKEMTLFRIDGSILTKFETDDTIESAFQRLKV